MAQPQRQVSYAEIEQNTKQTMEAIERIRQTFLADNEAGKPHLCQLIQQTLMVMPWTIPVLNILPGITIVTARGQYSVNFSQQMHDEDMEDMKHQLRASQQQQGQGRLFT